MRLSILIFVVFITLFCGNFTNSYAQAPTKSVTSVTMSIDTITNVSQMEKARNIILAHSEVDNFDIKLRKCNFTLTNANAASTFQLIKKELQAAGFAVALLDMKSNQVFTTPTVDNCDTRHPARKNDPDK
ncbi:MAG: hypothetical protein H6581_29825 [Bacteroidia bacterium]|nr:hypothetical protein [Bacteroidia bacterium]